MYLLSLKWPKIKIITQLIVLIHNAGDYILYSVVKKIKFLKKNVYYFMYYYMYIIYLDQSNIVL